jgi:hypothetical protein
MSQESLELVRRMFDSWNAGDVVEELELRPGGDRVLVLATYRVQRGAPGPRWPPRWRG